MRPERVKRRKLPKIKPLLKKKSRINKKKTQIKIRNKALRHLK